MILKLITFDLFTFPFRFRIAKLFSFILRLNNRLLPERNLNYCGSKSILARLVVCLGNIRLQEYKRTHKSHDLRSKLVTHAIQIDYIQYFQIVKLIKSNSNNYKSRILLRGGLEIY